MAVRVDDVVINDLICFVQNKLEGYPVEKLKPIIVDGFTSEAITASRDLLFDMVNERDQRKELNIRKKVHKQTGKTTVTQMNVSDILKVFTESS